jgi:lactate dehydrogenase-like 2-hydroxyacid dehydrogenase
MLSNRHLFTFFEYVGAIFYFCSCSTVLVAEHTMSMLLNYVTKFTGICNKSDANHAAALVEAASRPTMPCVL